VIKWRRVCLKWLWVLATPGRYYPEILVLELGVDRPSDMHYLLSFIRPTVGVVTNISSSHLEFFHDLDNIAKEKGELIEALPADGLAVLNADDTRVRAMAKRSNAPVQTFGLLEQAEVQGSDVIFSYKDGVPQGLSFKLNDEGRVVPLRLPHIVAPHLLYAVLAAVAVGIYFKVNLVEAASMLQEFRSPLGRMQLIAGIKRSTIIDDTYNSSPVSALAALETLEAIVAKRKVAMLGDMLELGIDSEAGHRQVANRAFEANAAVVIAVGDRMGRAVKDAARHYMGVQAFYFDDPELAGKFLRTTMKDGDLVLVKGSQGMRLEKAVEEVMSESDRADEFLCRQTPEWRKKAYVKP
ncbi:UDP-N-acetylmuramoyl-tripeptide--D-alanyl-D-alanine ligase, partial [Patescibacteria group bacterium]